MLVPTQSRSTRIEDPDDQESENVRNGEVGIAACADRHITLFPLCRYDSISLFRHGLWRRVASEKSYVCKASFPILRFEAKAFGVLADAALDRIAGAVRELDVDLHGDAYRRVRIGGQQGNHFFRDRVEPGLC